MASTTQKTASFVAMDKAGEDDPAIKDRVDLYKYREIEEFYALENDPHELTNKVDDVGYQAVVEQFRAQLVDWMIATNDPALSAFIRRDNVNYLASWMEHQQAETTARGTKLGRKHAVAFHVNNDYFNIRQGESLNISAELGISANDYFLDSAVTNSATLISNVTNGTLNLSDNGSGAFTYQPNDSFTGVDSFVYQLQTFDIDGTLINSGEASVFFTVVSENNTMAYPTTISTPSSISISNDNASSNELFHTQLSAIDTNGFKLSYKLLAGPSWIRLYNTEDATAIADGESGATDEDKALAALNDVTDKLVGIPTTDDIGNQSITIEVSNGFNTHQQTLNLTVNPPPIFADDFEGQDDINTHWTNAASGVIEKVTGAAKSGLYGARAKNGASMATTVSTTSHENIFLAFDYKVKDITLTIEWSIDGSTFTPFTELLTDTEFTHKSLNFPVAANNQESLTIRFVTDGNLNTKQALIDNVYIAGSLIE